MTKSKGGDIDESYELVARELGTSFGVCIFKLTEGSDHAEGGQLHPAMMNECEPDAHIGHIGNHFFSLEEMSGPGLETIVVSKSTTGLFEGVVNFGNVYYAVRDFGMYPWPTGNGKPSSTIREWFAGYGVIEGCIKASHCCPLVALVGSLILANKWSPLRGEQQPSVSYVPSANKANGCDCGPVLVVRYYNITTSYYHTTVYFYH